MLQAITGPQLGVAVIAHDFSMAQRAQRMADARQAPAERAREDAIAGSSFLSRASFIMFRKILKPCARPSSCCEVAKLCKYVTPAVRADAGEFINAVVLDGAVDRQAAVNEYQNSRFDPKRASDLGRRASVDRSSPPLNSSLAPDKFRM